MRKHQWLLSFAPMVMLYTAVPVMSDELDAVARKTFDLGLSVERSCCFCFSNANDLFALADYRSGTVQLYDLPELALRSRLVGFPREEGLTGFSNVRFSSDDRQVAVVYQGPKLRISDVRDQTTLDEFAPECDTCWSTAISSDLNSLAIGETWNISLWDVRQKRRAYTIEGKSRYIWSLAFSRTAEYMVSTSLGRWGWPRVWNVNDGQEAVQLEGLGTYEHVYQKNGQQLTAVLPKSDVDWLYVAFSSDGTMLAASGQRNAKPSEENAAACGVARLWNLATGKVICSIEMPDSVLGAIAVVPERNWIIVAGCSEARSCDQPDAWCVKLFAIDSAYEVHSLKGHTDAVINVQVSRDGRWAATGSRDKTVRLWDLSQLK